VHNKNEAILAAIRQGAISPTELFSLDELAELFCSLSPDMLRRIAHAVRQELEHWYLLGEDKQIICTDRKQASILTKTERNILILCARGLPNAEIADRLFITRGTVKTLVNRAWTKLGASNRAEAVIFALKQREITICDICSPNEVAKDLTMLGAETIERMAQLLNQKLVQEQIPTGS
jgi:DNA-binding CsgD family transcriptional regulator